MNTEILVWDNEVTAREYISYISEQAGAFACIGRDGKLYFKQIGENSIELDKKFLKDIKYGELFKISCIAYEDGVQDFKQGTTKDSTVWINQDNMYINKQEQIDAIYDYYKDFKCYSFEGGLIIDPAIDVGDVIIIDEKPVIYQGELSYCGKFFSNIKSEIKSKAKQESSTREKSEKSKIRRLESKINEAEGNITLLGKEVTEYEDKLSEIKLDIDSITHKVENIAGITREVEGITKIQLDECMKGQLLELHIYGNNTAFKWTYPSNFLYPSDLVYPGGNSKIRVYSEDLSYDETIDLRIKDVLRQYEGVCDEYILKDNKAQIIRRIGVDSNNNKYILENEKIEDLGELVIGLQKGTNYIEILDYIANLKAKYVFTNDFTMHFASIVEMHSLIQQLTQQILLEVYKKIGKEEIIARINMAILGKDDAEIPEDIEKSIIEILANKISIKSDNFELTKNGVIKAVAGMIAGLTMNSQSNGSYLFKDYTSGSNKYQSGFFVPHTGNGSTQFLYAGVDITNGSNSLSNANTYIRHDGLINAKWFRVNGESGYFYVDYNSNRRAMHLSKNGIYWYLDDERNGNWFSFFKDTNGQWFSLYDAPFLGVYDGVHGQSMLNFYKYNPNVSGNERLGHLAAFFSRIECNGNRADGVNNSIYIQGYEVATNASDRRLKKRIKKSKYDALNIVNQIEIDEFDWRKPRNHKRKHIDFGYIAQDTQEVLESLVDYDKINDKYQMNLLNLSALHTKAIQELSKENKELKEENEKQNKMINFLINKLNCKEEFEEYMRGEK